MLTTPTKSLHHVFYVLLGCALLMAGCRREPGGLPAAESNGSTVPNAATRDAPATMASATVPAASSQPIDPVLQRGLALYAKNCATCHGEKGSGDGPAAYLIYPRPRNFGGGEFRITSTTSGLPSDQDLLQTLRRGMPGSAMPPWGHLANEDLTALVRTVRYLAVQGKMQRLMASDKKLKPEKALAIAERSLASGAAVELPKADPAKVNPARGKELYTANCAACHGTDGRGRDKKDLLDASGLPIFARDFTLGIFKGDATAEELAKRIVIGVPGSPMPAAAEMPPEDLWSLVAYVQTFIKPGAQERVRQVQQTLTARHITGPVQADPDGSQWKDVPATFLPVMPLWWRDDRIEGVTIRAIHDGSKLAIRVDWQDATKNDEPLKPQSFTDGAAIQISPEIDPPLFAMGTKQSLVNIWHWKAAWERDIATGTSPGMNAAYPNMAHDEYVSPIHDPLYQTATSAGNPVATTQHASAVENLHAAGIGTLTSRAPGLQNVTGKGVWTDGGWHVVFVRPLAAEGQIKLEPGGVVSIGFAAWDGNSGDRNGQKSITIWHRLALEK